MLACCISAAARPAEPKLAALAQVANTESIPIGQSVALLRGPWKFHIGDSPRSSVTNTPEWAEPSFDDSKWETVDLESNQGAGSPGTERVESIAGWTAQGHAGYWGYAWYRIRLHLVTRQDDNLALAGPANVDDAYQVFLDGRLLGSFGDFTGSRPITYYNQPTMFPFSHAENGNSVSSTEVLAFRVWMGPNTLATSPNAGGLRSAPAVGQADAVQARFQLLRLDLIRKYSPFVINAILFALLAVVSFSLVLLDRSDRVYLWMGAVFLLTATYSGLGALAVWTQYLSILADSLITQCFLGPLAYAGWVMVWWVWFGRQRPAWLPGAAAGLTLLYMISNAIAVELFYSFIPHSVAVGFEVVSLMVRLLFVVILLWIVMQGIRRQGLEGWLVLPAIVPLGVGLFQTELAFVHVQLNWFPSGVMVALPQIANLLMVTALSLLLLRRLLLSVRRQRLIEMDAKRAQLQSDFVAAVSHEFRSPLTTLRSIVELLVQNRISDDAARQQSYGFLDREAKRLQRLVEDLLDFGRMESGRKQYRMGTHDAFQLVRAAVADVGEQAAASSFQVKTTFDTIPAAVYADDEAFRRAVRNLLENAIKYSPECRTVWVDGRVDNGRVTISVRDQGMGIETIEQQAIFQKFVRGDAAKKAGIKGTGIGLAMVQQIADAMGGEIRVQSEVGVGSTFTLVLPLATP